MKPIITSVFILMILGLTIAQGQSKKDLEQDYATCISARDSLQQELTGLSATHESLIQVYDSIQKVCTVYDTMYNVLKTKVVHYDFDPANTAALIDSLSVVSESAFSGMSTSLNDSIAALNKENADLKASIEILKTETADKTDVVNDLKQLKELLDTGIITQEEFDSKKAKLLEKL